MNVKGALLNKISLVGRSPFEKMVLVFFLVSVASAFIRWNESREHDRS